MINNMCKETQGVIHTAAATLKTEFGANGRKKRHYWNKLLLYK